VIINAKFAKQHGCVEIEIAIFLYDSNDMCLVIDSLCGDLDLCDVVIVVIVIVVVVIIWEIECEEGM